MARPACLYLGFPQASQRVCMKKPVARQQFGTQSGLGMGLEAGHEHQGAMARQ